MKNKVIWLLMIMMMANLAAQTFCFASSISQSIQPKQKKTAVTQVKAKSTTSNSKYWVLGALFKV